MHYSFAIAKQFAIHSKHATKFDRLLKNQEKAKKRLYIKKIRKQKRIIQKLRAKIKLLEQSKTEAEPAAVGEDDESNRNQLLTNHLADIKNAAIENTASQMGLIFEPVSGSWFDPNTKYYFIPSYNLWYDSENGCYLMKNERTGEFEFHSQVTSGTTQEQSVEVEKESIKKDKKSRHKSHKRKRRRSSSSQYSSDLDREDGEISGSDSSSSESEKEERLFRKKKDIACKYPPSMRLIVIETDLKLLKKGSLFLVTYKGGSLGREGSHDVLIPDINISKQHLKFFYNHKKNYYECQDVGSRNGTLVNGEKLSESQKESARVPLLHDDVIEISKTKILCHIHQGTTTCTKCEPGLVQQTSEPATAVVVVQKEPVLSHKEQLKQLQKRYGLEKQKYAGDEAQVQQDQQYNDRADERRKKFGSSCEGEKTESTSMDTSISNKNKGFKMLTKLGWSKGESLGKSSNGILEPVPLISNEGTRGLGNDGPSNINLPKKMKTKIEILKKTQQRYHEN